MIDIDTFDNFLKQIMRNLIRDIPSTSYLNFISGAASWHKDGASMTSVTISGSVYSGIYVLSYWESFVVYWLGGDDIRINQTVDNNRMSNVQTNVDTLVPTSSLIYNMNQTIINTNDALAKFTEK